MLHLLRKVTIAASISLLAASSVSAGALGIKNGKVAVTSPDGLSDATYTLKEPEPLPKTIELQEGGTFKLTFTIVDTASGDSVYPKQAHLLFEDLKGEEDVTLPVTVRENGKAGFTINTAKPPPALLASHGQFALTLLLSTLDSATTTPLAYPLGRLSLPASILRLIPRKRHDLPPRAGEPAFQPQQEIFHTFKPEDQTVGYTKSMVGTVIVLAPWLVLLALLGNVSGGLQWKSPPTSSWIFLGFLAALEGLIMVYWVKLKLYQFLPYFLGLALVSAYSGKVALAALREQRLKAGGKP